MADIYIRLSYDEYKTIEIAMREFKETVHTTVTGYYHKSIRIPFDTGHIEFHGPAVMADEEGRA